VWGGNTLVAAISVDQLTSQRRITPAQLESLRLFAGYAGLAIENARLHDALGNDLNQRKSLIEELEKKNMELERFTYTVSHDLKSPLVTITGFLGYLHQDARAGNFENFKRDMDRIHQAVDKMQILLNDLLELSRIGRIIHEPVEEDFGAIVHDALSLLNGSITAGNIHVHFVDDGCKITGDRLRLLEVIQNLVENAIKFMGTQKKPEIHIGSIKDDDGNPVFFVRDNGIGIDPQYQDRVFGIFNKLDAKTEGSGIGLTLVKRIIEVHNGRIWLTSQPGEGTTFFFTIPAANINE
jgi:signal transduction histidine kinase